MKIVGGPRAKTQSRKNRYDPNTFRYPARRSASARAFLTVSAFRIPRSAMPTIIAGGRGIRFENGMWDFKGSPTQGLRPCPRTVFGENPSLSLCQSAFAPHIPKYDPPPMISGDHAALCVRWGVIMATVGEEGGAIARCHFHMMPNTQFNLPFKVCLSGV